MSSIPPEMAKKINELQQRIERGHALEAQGQLEQARTEYWACLQTASQQKLLLMVDQVAGIWMGLGFCEASRKAFDKALEWYFRVEAMLRSAPQLNPNPETPTAREHAKKWAQYLPEGVTVLFPENEPVLPKLANIYTSIAIAYDRQNNLEQAKLYYDRSIELYERSNHRPLAGGVRWQQLLGYQHRQQWFELENVGEKTLAAAQTSGDQHLELNCRRLLAQSQANQDRLFKAMEHLTLAVTLARELRDEDLATDEDLLSHLIKGIRPGILQRGQADFFEPLLAAERILNHPDYFKDLALYERLRAQQPATLTPGQHIPIGKLDAFEPVLMILAHFAARHCGPPKRTVEHPPSGLGKLFGGKPHTETVPVWHVQQETMYMAREDESGKPIQGDVTCATLTLFGTPEVVLVIELKSAKCELTVMETRPLKGTNSTALFSTHRESAPAEAEPLLELLNSLLLRGIFRKTKTGLQLANPKGPIEG